MALSDEHAKRHIKEWTGKWRRDHGDNGLSLNVIAALLVDDYINVARLLQEIPFYPYLCMNIKAPVWLPFKPVSFGKLSARDAVAWTEARVRALALELAQKHPGYGFRNGEPRKDEISRVAQALGTGTPPTPLEDKKCWHCLANTKKKKTPKFDQITLADLPHEVVEEMLIGPQPGGPIPPMPPPPTMLFAETTAAQFHTQPMPTMAEPPPWGMATETWIGPGNNTGGTADAN